MVSLFKRHTLLNGFIRAQLSRARFDCVHHSNVHKIAMHHQTIFINKNNVVTTAKDLITTVKSPIPAQTKTGRLRGRVIGYIIIIANA